MKIAMIYQALSPQGNGWFATPRKFHSIFAGNFSRGRLCLACTNEHLIAIPPRY